MSLPLVSVSVASYNAERTLPLCLESIRRQTYPRLELLLVDSYSKDGTRRIAREYGAKIIDCPGRLLEARYLGAKEAKGDFVLLLDTDQVLKPNTIERAVEMMESEGYDMLVLEEESFNREWVIPRLYAASKLIISSRFYSDYSFDPMKGGNPARFFRRWLLLKALDAIPQELIPEMVHYDHDVLYYEAYRLSQRVGLLRKGIYHIEPDFGKLWRTNVRYGASLRFVKGSHYWELFLKERGSGFWFGRPYREGILALLLHILLKGVQLVGYYLYGTKALGPSPLPRRPQPLKPSTEAGAKEAPPSIQEPIPERTTASARPRA